MIDQAQGLRQLVETRRSATAAAEPAARVLLLTSGKGGVGTSNLALNLGIALGAAGARVVVVDADFGLANLDLLGGLAPPRDLGSVLVRGEAPAAALVAGPGGIRVLAGAHGLRTPAAALAAAPERLAEAVAEFERDADFILIDAGSGLVPPPALVGAAAEVIVVTTPEPTALADTHALLAELGRSVLPARPRFRVLVNQVCSRREAAECLERIRAAGREFLGMVVEPLGSVRADPRVGRAVRRRQPFLTAAPHGPAARGVRRLARTLIAERTARPDRAGLAFPWRRQPRAPAAVAAGRRAAG